MIVGRHPFARQFSVSELWTPARVCPDHNLRALAAAPARRVGTRVQLVTAACRSSRSIMVGLF